MDPTSSTPIIRHELQGRAELVIGRDGPQHMLVVDGPGGLETVTHFDNVRISPRSIVIRVAESTFAPTYVEFGSIENDDFGDVIEQLEQFAAGNVIAELQYHEGFGITPERNARSLADSMKEIFD